MPWPAATACRWCVCSVGSPRPLQAYGAVGYDGPRVCAQVAEEWAQRGFKGVKAKIGYPTVKEDVEVIRAIRKAVGDDVAIMVDYNQCLTPAEAVERIRVLDHEGLAWVEEPTLAHDFAGHAEIAREVQTPIQCGENWWGRSDVQHALDARASDYVMLDVMKVGGVTGWLRASALAQRQGNSRVEPPLARAQRSSSASRRRRTGSSMRTGGTRSRASPCRSRTAWPTSPGRPAPG